MKIAALQQAVYTRINSQLGGSVVGVYSNVPQAAQSEDDSAFPFITIGPVTPTSWSTDDTPGITALVDVGVWTRSTSDLVRRGLADAVYDAMNRYQLPITGVNTVDCLFDNMVEFMDPDGVTTHSVVTFRVTYDGA